MGKILSVDDRQMARLRRFKAQALEFRQLVHAAMRDPQPWRLRQLDVRTERFIEIVARLIDIPDDDEGEQH